MTRKSKRDVERRLDDLESERDPDVGEMTKEELAEAWRAALDPERPNPGIEGSDAYSEMLRRKEDRDR